MTGLLATINSPPVIDDYFVNTNCSRRDSNGHTWAVYVADAVTGDIRPNVDETRGVFVGP